MRSIWLALSNRVGLRGQNSTNAIASVLQVFIDSGVVVLIYAVAFRHCNASELGAWAFVNAGLMFSRISDVTIPPTIVSFTARMKAKDADDAVSSVIAGGAYRVFVRVGIASTLVMLCLSVYVLFAVIGDERNVLLQLAMVSWINTFLLALATTATAGLDGLRRTDLRVGAIAVANLSRIAVTLVFVKQIGIFGFAYGLAAHSLTLLIMSTLLLFRAHPKLLSVIQQRPAPWSDEMILFGRSFRIAGVLQLFLEPTTKVLFPFFADLSSLGYYDVASKFVQQVRAAMLAPASLLLAIFSSKSTENTDVSRDLYIKATRIAFIFCSVGFASVICSLPLLSLFWIASVQEEFVIYGCVLSLSWGVNAFSSIAYYYLLAEGKLLAVTKSNVVMASMNIVCGITGGMIYAGVGCASGVAIAIGVGSFILIVAANRGLQVPIVYSIGRASVFCCLVSMLGAFWSCSHSLNAGFAGDEILPMVAKSAGICLLFVVFLHSIAFVNVLRSPRFEHASE